MILEIHIWIEMFQILRNHSHRYLILWVWKPIGTWSLGACHRTAFLCLGCIGWETTCRSSRTTIWLCPARATCWSVRPGYKTRPITLVWPKTWPPRDSVTRRCSLFTVNFDFVCLVIRVGNYPKCIVIWKDIEKNHSFYLTSFGTFFDSFLKKKNFKSSSHQSSNKCLRFRIELL